VGLEEGLFPHQRALEEGQIEEERRLAYVAFTRAKKELVLTYASVRGQAVAEHRPPSTFLLELPRELLWDPERRKPPELVAPAKAASSSSQPTPPPAARAEGAAARGEGAAAQGVAVAKVPLWKRSLSSAQKA